MYVCTLKLQDLAYAFSSSKGLTYVYVYEEEEKNASVCTPWFDSLLLNKKISILSVLFFFKVDCRDLQMGQAIEVKSDLSSLLDVFDGAVQRSVAHTPKDQDAGKSSASFTWTRGYSYFLYS